MFGRDLQWDAFLLHPAYPRGRRVGQIVRTRSMWAQRLPSILANYVRRQQISRSFVLLSKQYAACVPTLTPAERRFVPSFTPGRDSGSAMRVVPGRIGAELSIMLPALLPSHRQTGRPG